MMESRSSVPRVCAFDLDDVNGASQEREQRGCVGECNQSLLDIGLIRL